ncbi:unnamed protein product [Pocillopora meandrina]|uniref:Uncharacterized protein n=1 Tax=Pocillopora meandrina TaxID=46732 RepID=A0AAU9XRC4_9CNID|nr:unnamed protein product [Pocillopora meandrina]
MGKAKKEWITVYRTDPGPIRWEKIPNESKKNDMSRAWFTAKEDSIHIKTMTFCFWCVYCRRGAPRKKRATVFASKPNPRRDLIFFRFYIYSDNKDSMRRVKTQDREQFPDSWKGMEKPFKMYNNSKKITVKLMVDPEKGWELDETPGEQVYICDDSHGGRFRYKDACAFAVKPVKGREVEEFSCSLSFQQEGHDTEHAIYLNPGFSLVEKSVEPGKARTHFNSASAAGCSTSSAPEERDRDNLDEQPRTSQGLNKSHSVNFPRQRHEANSGPEVNLPTLKRSKKAKSSTQGEGDRANLDEQSKTRQDSKPLSSLLDNGPLLEKVCNRLDSSRPGVGDYRDVCSHYGIDSFQVTAVYEKHTDGPSKALLEHLAASHEQLTVAEFARVLREIAKRGDIAKILEEYDNQ